VQCTTRNASTDFRVTNTALELSVSGSTSSSPEPPRRRRRGPLSSLGWPLDSTSLGRPETTGMRFPCGETRGDPGQAHVSSRDRAVVAFVTARSGVQKVAGETPDCSTLDLCRHERAGRRVVHMQPPGHAPAQSQPAGVGCPEKLGVPRIAWTFGFGARRSRAVNELRMTAVRQMA